MTDHETINPRDEDRASTMDILDIPTTDINRTLTDPIIAAAFAASATDPGDLRATADAQKAFRLLVQAAIVAGDRLSPEFGPHREHWYLAAIRAFADAVARGL